MPKAAPITGRGPCWLIRDAVTHWMTWTIARGARLGCWGRWRCPGFWHPVCREAPCSREEDWAVPWGQAGPALVQSPRGGCKSEASPSPDTRDREIPQSLIHYPELRSEVCGFFLPAEDGWRQGFQGVGSDKLRNPVTLQRTEVTLAPVSVCSGCRRTKMGWLKQRGSSPHGSGGWRPEVQVLGAGSS